jgi:hypothetical protein
VNYHTVADFRAEHEAVFDGLLTDSVAALLAVGAVKLKRVAQDGMRVRASAGAFRSGGEGRWSAVWKTPRRKWNCSSSRPKTTRAR